MNLSRYRDRRTFLIGGPKGSGKTKLAQDYVRSHASAFYLSFENLSGPEALEAFRLQYIPDTPAVSDWTDAVDAFMARRNKQTTFLVFEDEKSDAMRQCEHAFLNYVSQTEYVRACKITSDVRRLDELDVFVGYRTPADHFHAFPDYSRQELLRLHALTGGILSVAKELEENCSFEENVRQLLAYDSAFTNTLPGWLAQSFRSPESYYPFFKSIAGGHHRLGEIAKDIGFPNNKCGKYLESLIRNGYVRAEKTESGKQSTYHLANSYYASWARYACAKQALQVAAPDKLLEFVLNDIDAAVALPAFAASCRRFIDRASKDYLRDYRTSRIERMQKSVTMKTEDGQDVLLDLFVQTDDAAYVFLFPHATDMRYTKKEIKNLYTALEQSGCYYNTHITVFSIERFSDWCVHEAKRNPWLHEVALERLRY